MNQTPLYQRMPNGSERTDERWTVTQEYTGKATPQFVARFCGDWIGQRSSYSSAVLLLAGERARHNGALVFVEQRA